MKYKKFTQDFKRSLIEQLLSEAATPLGEGFNRPAAQELPQNILLGL